MPLKAFFRLCYEAACFRSASPTRFARAARRGMGRAWRRQLRFFGATDVWVTEAKASATAWGGNDSCSRDLGIAKRGSVRYLSR